jgi:hypothetical protein
MSVETSGDADEYWSEYCLNPDCADPQCNHGGPDVDAELANFVPEVRLEKCWINPAYRNEVRWEVTLRINPWMHSHLYESHDRDFALKYARETAERTGLTVSIHDRTN